MSLCQPKKGKVSCGACCGITNIQLPDQELKKLIQDRTIEFQESVDWTKPFTVPAYRQNREKKEDSLPKKDKTIYNCPFLGYLSPKEDKIGCLIHPERTGNPKSQNYSFYGSSICLGYECKNLESPNFKFWEEVFQEIANDSIEYSRFSANHPWVRRIENSLGIHPKENANYRLNQMKIPIQELWKEIQKKLLESNEIFFTSFEINYEPNETPETSTEILSQIWPKWKEITKSILTV